MHAWNGRALCFSFPLCPAHMHLVMVLISPCDISKCATGKKSLSRAKQSINFCNFFVSFKFNLNCVGCHDSWPVKWYFFFGWNVYRVMHIRQPGATTSYVPDLCRQIVRLQLVPPFLQCQPLMEVNMTSPYSFGRSILNLDHTILNLTY